MFPACTIGWKTATLKMRAIASSNSSKTSSVEVFSSSSYTRRDPCVCTIGETRVAGEAGGRGGGGGLGARREERASEEVSYGFAHLLE